MILSRFELLTFRLGGGRSIQLSYRITCFISFGQHTFFPYSLQVALSDRLCCQWISVLTRWIFGEENIFLTAGMNEMELLPYIIRFVFQ